MKKELLMLIAIFAVLPIAFVRASPVECDLAFGEMPPAKAKKKVAPKEVAKAPINEFKKSVLDKVRDGTATSKEAIEVQRAVLKAFYGKNPVLFSLNHLLAYDKVIQENYRVDAPMTRSDLPPSMTSKETKKFWAEEQKKYSARLKEFSLRLERMSETQKRDLAKKITTSVTYLPTIGTKFMVAETPVYYGFTKNRLPQKHMTRLEETETLLRTGLGANEREALEQLVYESLIPLSKLAIKSQLKDRVGGRLAREPQPLIASIAMAGVGAGAAASAAFLVASFSHGVDVADTIRAAGSLVGGGLLGAIGAGTSIQVTTPILRTPEIIEDAFSNWRVARVKRAFFKQTESSLKIDESEVTPEKIDEAALKDLKISSLSAEKEFDRIDAGERRLSDFGGELQSGLRMIVDMHMNINIQQVEELERISPLLKQLQSEQDNSAALQKALIAGKYSTLETELGRLDGQYFASAQEITKMRRELKTIDSKLAKFVGTLDEKITTSPADETALLIQRRESLVASQSFAKLQFLAMDLSEKKLMENIKTVESLRALLISLRSGATVTTDSQNHEIKALVESLEGTKTQTLPNPTKIKLKTFGNHPGF
jgi:hypothetical protein